MNEELIRILIAEDDTIVRTLMAAALEKAGCEVVLAEDGEEALHQFRDQPCDMVLLDVDMPGMNGYEVCAAIRGEAGEELPIVMVTGMDDVESVALAFEAGATDFIAKPINWALIGHRVRHLFRAFQVLEELHQAHASNAAILDAVPDTMLRLDADGMVLGVHQKSIDQLAATLVVHAGQALTESLPNEVASRIQAAAASACTGRAAEGFEFEMAGGGNASRHYEARLVAIDEDQALCLLRDITERKDAARRIFRLAYFDTLTGLPNRLSFSEQLERTLQRAKRQNDGLAVLFLDLDRFKDVNDTLGHNAGDQLLCLVAERLRHSVRPGDMVARAGTIVDLVDLARMGGDEFVLLVPHLRQGEDALVLAQRIHQIMHRPFVLEGREIAVTASIGIALYPDDGEDTASLLKHADTAMYHAKDLGRDNAQFYSTSLTESAVRRMDLENNLRLAMERDEFFLVYQPQLDVDSGVIRSIEALIRWQSPQQGLVSPMNFIPFAEANGLIVPIGEWVLRTACADLARWQSGGQPLSIAVNLSSVQIRAPGLVGQFEAILAETGIAPECLELEVTEGVLMDDSAATLATLNAFREAGLQLSLDDFGTGYSSLSYLRRLPLDNLKIDRSFVSGLPEDAQDLAIVRTIIAMAKNLGITLTAEGVETIEQARILRDLGCETLQGYWISKPVRAGAIPAMLAQRWELDEEVASRV